MNLEDIANRPQYRPSNTSKTSSVIPENTLLYSDKMDSHSHSSSRFIPGPSPGPNNHVNQGPEIPEEMDFSGFQSFMDMATADMNLMPFCLNDDGLWNLSSGNTGL